MTGDEPIRVQCPCCGAWQELALDPGSDGEMVQDCEVCCEPWQMRVRRGRNGRLSVELDRIG